MLRKKNKAMKYGYTNCLYNFNIIAELLKLSLHYLSTNEAIWNPS